MNKKTLILVAAVSLIIYGFTSKKGIFAYENANIVNSSEVSRITIDYSWGGMYASRKYNYVISKAEDKFQTSQGKKVDEDKVMGLFKALVNLQKSGGMKGCFSHTDDYPYFRIELVYANGEKAILYSDSNCKENIPWNVVYKNKLYVQYTGEIPKALYSLLNDIEPENWKPLSDVSYSDSANIAIISDRLPEEIRQTGFSEVKILRELEIDDFFNRAIERWQIDFSEEKIYRNILCSSNKFRPFLVGHRIRKLELYCQLSKNNPDCSEINGIVTLAPLIGNNIESIPVKFKRQQLVETGISVEEKRYVMRKIKTHALVKNIKRIKPGSAVIIEHWGRTPSNNYQNIFSGLGTAIPSECSPYFISFDKWGAYNGFIYFPEVDKIWVEHLHFRQENYQKDKDILGLDNLLQFYKIKGYENFVDENVLDFEIQTCHRMMAYFKQDTLQKNPGYIAKLKEKYPDLSQYDNRIDIYGYCVFIDEEGEFGCTKMD